MLQTQEVTDCTRRNWTGSVSVVTELQVGESRTYGLILGRNKLFFSLKHPDWLCVLPSLMCNGQHESDSSRPTSAKAKNA